MITEGVENNKRVNGYNGTRDELYKKSAELSWKSFAKYAEKINATHHKTDKRVFTKGAGVDTHIYLFECLRVIYDPIYDKYDNVLYVDSDIICNTEENIFDLVNDTFDVAGIYESEIRNGDGRCGYNGWDRNPGRYQAIKNKYDRLNLPICGPLPPARPSKVAIFNTGVLLWTKEGRLKARAKFDDWFDYYQDGVKNKDAKWVNNDQPYISSQIMKHGLRVRLLDQKWNDSPPHYKHYEQWQNQNFLHYTAGFGKVAMLGHHRVNLFKYI